MNKNEKKIEKTKFKGTVVNTFTIGTKKPKKFKKGQSFETEDEKLFNHLLNTVKIKK